MRKNLLCLFIVIIIAISLVFTLTACGEDTDTQGNVLISGEGAPNNDQYKVGDSYIDTTTWDFYVKKDDGWHKEGNIKGSDGSNGQNGSDGESYTIEVDENGRIIVNGQDTGFKAADDVAFSHADEFGKWTIYKDTTCVLEPAGSALTTATMEIGPLAGIVSEVTIKGDITSIGANYFEKYKFMKSITIPDTVTNIGESAFEGCSNLKDITIPKNLTVIGDKAFKSCSSITSLILPDGVTDIGNDALVCSSLERITIPANATIGTGNIGGDSIKYANVPYAVLDQMGIGKLEELILSKGTAIADNLFKDIATLKSVVIAEGFETIGDNVFKGCSSLESAVIGNGVTTIGDYVFRDCTSLKSITIPSSLTSIGEGNIGATSAENDSVLEYANVPCVALSRVYAPSTMEEIVINAGTEIGSGKFNYWSKLETITIPASVTTIGENAFSSCYSLKRVKITDIGAWCSIDFDSWTSNPLYQAENLYLNDELVKEIIIPNGIVKIGKYSFYNCTSLTSVTIPNTVTEIGTHAFSNCSSLTSIEIPNSVESLGDGIFEECSKLTSANIPANENLTSLPNNLFNHCSSLNIITIPNNITSIGQYTFANCASVESIVIPNTVETINRGAFWGCSSLKSVNIPNNSGLTILEWNSFRDCVKLETITIPDNITSIDMCVFMDCTGLSSISFTNSIASVGISAFEGCSSLKSITFYGTESEYENISFSSSAMSGVPTDLVVTYVN